MIKQGYTAAGRTNRYPNGYEEKIGYWSYKLNKAISNLDVEGIKFAASRLEYFVGRQKEVNERLEQLYK